MSTFHNDPEQSLTKINTHTAFGYSLRINCSFDKTKKRLIVIEVKIVR